MMDSRMRSTAWIPALVCVAGLVFGGSAAAADKGVAIGEEMPGFTMEDYNGKEHSLSDYEGKIVVLNFCSQNCPWSRGVDPEISKVAEKYSEKGIVFLGIDSDKNNAPSDIEQHAEKVGVQYPILKDDKNVYADKANAGRTPEIYIVDKDGKLAYHGAYDNRTVPTESGETNYVTAALDELLAGKDVSTKKVAAWGCTIKRAVHRDS